MALIKLLVFEVTYHIYYIVAPISGILHDFFFLRRGMLLLSLFLGVPSIPVFLKTLNVKRSHLLMASVARAVVPFGSVCGSFLLWHTHVPPPQGQIVYFGLPSNSRVILGCLII